MNQNEQVIMTSTPCENCGCSEYRLIATQEQRFPDKQRVLVIEEEIWECLNCGDILINYDATDEEAA